MKLQHYVKDTPGQATAVFGADNGDAWHFRLIEDDPSSPRNWRASTRIEVAHVASSAAPVGQVNAPSTRPDACAHTARVSDEDFTTWVSGPRMFLDIDDYWTALLVWCMSLPDGEAAMQEFPRFGAGC